MVCEPELGPPAVFGGKPTLATPSSMPCRTPNVPCEPELNPPGVFGGKPTLPPPPSLWGVHEAKILRRDLLLQCPPPGGMVPQHMLTSCASFPYPMPLLPPPPQWPLPPPPAPPVGHAIRPTPPFHGNVGSKMVEEFFLPCEAKMTLFVGKFPPSLEDGFLTSILKLCGPIRSWTRGSDLVSGSLKGFGFCEYESPEGLLRALRLLQRLKLEGQELVLKADNATLKHLEYYVDRKIQWFSHKKDELGHVPGLEATDVEILQAIPIEERLGWVCDMQKKIDKEVSVNLQRLLQERGMTKPDGLSSSNIGDLGLGSSGENAQKSAMEATLERSKVVEWRQFDYELERCKLKGIRKKCRSSLSHYIELGNLWEKREEQRRSMVKLERERDRERTEVRRRRIREEEKIGEIQKWRSCKDKYAKTRVEREEDDRSSAHERASLNSKSRGGDVSSSVVLDLSTRAKVSFRFKSSVMQMAASIDGSGDGGGGEGLVRKGYGEPLPNPMEVWSGWGNAHRINYRNPTFTWEPVSTPAEEPVVLVEKVVADSVQRIMEADPEQGREHTTSRSNKALDLKEIIDMIPSTKEALFSCDMDWETFDKHGLHERIRPWISKKIMEFLGEEEVTLVDFIVTSSRKHITPSHLLELLENIFVEEAELFVVKLWRMVIYETKKVELGLPGSC